MIAFETYRAKVNATTLRDSRIVAFNQAFAEGLLQKLPTPAALWRLVEFVEFSWRKDPVSSSSGVKRVSWEKEEEDLIRLLVKQRGKDWVYIAGQVNLLIENKKEVRKKNNINKIY